MKKEKKNRGHMTLALDFSHNQAEFSSRDCILGPCSNTLSPINKHTTAIKCMCAEAYMQSKNFFNNFHSYYQLWKKFYAGKWSSKLIHLALETLDQSWNELMATLQSFASLGSFSTTDPGRHDARHVSSWLTFREMGCAW